MATRNSNSQVDEIERSQKTGISKSKRPREPCEVEIDFCLWRSSPRVSNPTKGFIILKLPLQAGYCEQKIDEQDFFTPRMAIDYMRNGGIPVGLFIDCTLDPQICYGKSYWARWDVDFFKVSSDEGNPIPSENSCEEFQKKCLDFYLKNEGKMIGLMDLYGYHTAGYLFARFLVDCCQIPLFEALGHFAAAQPPGLYCPNHLKALAYRYNLNGSIKVPRPPFWDQEIKTSRFQTYPQNLLKTTQLSKGKRLFPGDSIPHDPSICKEFSDSPESMATSSDSSSFAPSQQLQSRRTLQSSLEFGSEVEEHQRTHVLTHMFSLLGLNLSNFQEFYFPSRGLSTSKLLKQDFFVTFDAIGHRALLFFKSSGSCYIVDKTLTCRKVQLNFPALSNTIIEGSFVEDCFPHPKTGAKIFRFLACDLLVVKSEKMLAKPLRKRLAKLREILPKDTRKNTVEPFKMRFQEHYESKKIEKVIKEVLPHLRYPVRGFIFTPPEERYSIPEHDPA